MQTQTPIGSWQSVTDRLARLRENLALVARGLADAEADLTENPLFLSLLDGAAECLDGAIRTLGGEAAEVEVPSAAKPGSGEAGLRGSTESLGMGELLTFLSSLQKSGTLVIRTAQEQFCVRLDRGTLVYATGDNNPVLLRLGEILVKQGALSEDVLRHFLHHEHDGGEVLGAALVRHGLVQEEDLKRALAYQVQHLFHRIHAAPRAEFEFRETEDEAGRGDLTLNVTSLLLEAARALDEAQTSR